MAKWVKILIGVGAGLLLFSILINVWGIRKVNYYKDEIHQIEQERKAWEAVADSVKKENILLDDSIADKKEAFKKLEDAKIEIRSRIDYLEYDDIMRELSEHYCGGDGDNPEDGTCPTDQGE